MHIEDLKILVSDDSMLARKQLKDIILTIGTPIFIEAKDGQDAIEKYKSETPDLVFLDIVMPRKDGIEAIKEIKAFDSNASIIIASSVGTQSQLKIAIEEGAKDFIQKPIDRNQVIEVVEKFLEGR
ncbi:response regulator [Lachnobacterium bovis]|jgi:two-component system chemotaxis response regulator CheY|uniref:Stage 0 sporulation protein A homolog n=1 Tax=Lachnobacterium bovis DSM 14045 TaxID=1122142 RepID=A0A1H3FC14_9FIRM|nr:response regulator [Lachnobacterium bovis]MBQ1802890.1 response regulator [Lachnobacterium sp.]SDX87689.1 two-component system, chemotaxis family, response regulator CheY [Lachnobacterium bovis DSM 14045]